MSFSLLLFNASVLTTIDIHSVLFLKPFFMEDSVQLAPSLCFC